ncbi:GGDEF domain-containing protein [Leucothrix sargassi]|nr:GGDEF domain-containing protein [Leucothrix sargassi]
MSINTVQSGVMTEIKQEQVTTLYRKTTLGFWGNLALAVILCVLFARLHHTNSAGHLTYYLAGWLVILIATCFYRLRVTQQFNPTQFHDSSSIILWANKHILLTTIINTIWGIAGFILMPDNNFAYQVFLTVILFSVLLISIPVLAISRFSYSIQIIAVLTPLIVSLVIADSLEKDGYLLPVSVVIFAVTLYCVSDYIHRTLMELRDSQSSLRKQANTDSLTQISNRRFFDLTFKNEWRRSTRDGMPISMLLVDIDMFSEFNETQGQRAGDNCLKAIASCMEVVTRRPADLAARYSGEEFAVLLPNTTMENAAMLGEKLRAKVESLQIAHPSSEFGVVTVSVGVSCCPPPEEKNSDDDEEEVMYPAMLMNAADNAMFLAKKQGRNRVAEQKCGEQRIAQVLQKYAEKEASRT